MYRLTPAQRAEFLANGVIVADGAFMIEDHDRDDLQLAIDAQPGLVTTANAAIPAAITTIVDPEVIRAVIAPMRFAEVFGEAKKGTWTDDAILFPQMESAGFVTSYGDWNNNGNVSSNISWNPRQPYFYQTVLQYGEREMEKAARVNWNIVSELNISAAIVMNQFQNKSYAFGTTGLQNYGVLNDPGLLPSIVPYTKAAGGTSWDNATQQEIYNDFLKLFAQLQAQMGGHIKQSDTIRVVLSPQKAVRLSAINNFTQTALGAIKLGFPNITIEQIPEYSTANGEFMQMILPTYQGTQTIYLAFPEKMRRFPVIASLSGWQQKQAGGTWGAIVRRPLAVAGMLGI